MIRTIFSVQNHQMIHTKYGTRTLAAGAVPGVCTHTRRVWQSSVDSAGRGRGDMGCDRHLDQTTKGQAAGTPVAADTVGSSTPAGEALRTFAAWVRGRGAMDMGVEKTLSNSQNGREACQKRRIGGKTRCRGDGGWAVRGVTSSGRATLRIFRYVATYS